MTDRPTTKRERNYNNDAFGDAFPFQLAIYCPDESFLVWVVEPRKPFNLLFMQCGNLCHPVPKLLSLSILLADFKLKCQNVGLLWTSLEERVGNERSLETFR
jgi:hypothetical protein